MKNNKKQIGFIGQGYIGKNYADDFEKRGFDVVRYSIEEPHINNKEKIKDCDVVFIAVPTPTNQNGFDGSIVLEAVKLVGDGRIAVIKSTILPGMTESIQDQNPDIFVLHSPEFLSESTADYDAANPDRNIIGIPKNTDEFVKKAEEVIKILPEAPYKKICNSRDSELIKYGGNCMFYEKVVFVNMLYDMACELDCDWETIKEIMVADPRIDGVHMNPVHKTGRGAGGHCFIKDYEAFSDLYRKLVGDELGVKLIEANINKNIDLLKKSGKDMDLLKGVYGKNI